MVRNPGYDRRIRSARLVISSANKRHGFTQVQGPRSVKPLLPARCIMVGVITVEAPARFNKPGMLRWILDALDVPSPSLYILGWVSRSPSRFTHRVSYSI